MLIIELPVGQRAKMTGTQLTQYMKNFSQACIQINILKVQDLL